MNTNLATMLFTVYNHLISTPNLKYSNIQSATIINGLLSQQQSCQFSSCKTSKTTNICRCETILKFIEKFIIKFIILITRNTAASKLIERKNRALI